MAASRRSRRQRTHQRSGMLLGIAGALIASLLVYQVFFRTDSTTPSASPASQSVGVVGTPGGQGSTTTTAPLQPTLPNGSFDELSLRDPFEPVIQVTPDGGTTPASSTTTTTQPGSISTTPTSSPQQNPAPTTDVALLDVYQGTGGVQTARIRVGTVEYTAVTGQVFAINYKLVSFTSATCVQLSYADSPFALCQGEQTTK